MEILILIISIVNLILLIGYGIHYFKKNYVILTAEEWGAIEEFVEAHKDDDNEEIIELPGGTGVEVGFNADYLMDDDEEDE